MKLMIVVLLMALFVTSCSSAPAPAAQNANMPNPASANCAEKGGDLEIRKEANGEVGYCKFPDGSECEEWAFFRNECQPKTPIATTAANMPNPASANCAEKGGDLEIRKEANGEVGYCKFPDGSECEEWAFFKGECQPKTPISSPTANVPNPASANCVVMGGTVEIRKDAGGGEVGYCKFPDGSECEEWALMRGECQPGAGPMNSAPPQSQGKRIVFPAGGVSAIEQGSLAGNESYVYVVRAMAVQTLSVKITAVQGQAILIIWGADGTVLISDHAGATEWSGVLPSTQDYNIHVRSVTTAWTDYWLNITIPPISQPQPQVKPIIFQAGAVSALLEDTLAANAVQRYSIRVLSGQTMSVNLTPVQGNAILVIYGADGTVLISDHAGAASWSGVVPSTQDYFIDVRSVTNIATDYWLQVTIPPL